MCIHYATGHFTPTITVIFCLLWSHQRQLCNLKMRSILSSQCNENSRNSIFWSQGSYAYLLLEIFCLLIWNLLFKKAMAKFCHYTITMCIVQSWLSLFATSYISQYSRSLEKPTNEWLLESLLTYCFYISHM